MLDAFLDVSYSREKTAEANTQLVESLKKLPNDLLMKIASGEEKLAYHGGFADSHYESWLDRFKGTPLFEQALQLEQQQLQLEMADKSRWAEEDAARSRDRAVRDEVCVKKKMLDLELAQLQEEHLQHEINETPEEEAAESPQEQAQERATGGELHGQQAAPSPGSVKTTTVKEQTPAAQAPAMKVASKAKVAVTGKWVGETMLRGHVQRLVNQGHRIGDAVTHLPGGSVAGAVAEAGQHGAVFDQATAGLSQAARSAQKRNMLNSFKEVSGVPALRPAVPQPPAPLASAVKPVAAPSPVGKVALASANGYSPEELEKVALNFLGAVKGMYNAAKAGWGGHGAAAAGAKALGAPTVGPMTAAQQLATKSGLSGAATNVAKYWGGLAKTRPGLAAGMVAAPAAVGGAMLGRATAPSQPQVNVVQ